jgi:hypothetical protein
MTFDDVRKMALLRRHWKALASKAAVKAHDAS